MDTLTEKEILVVSGGSIKGFTSLGCITKLKELKIINNLKVYCGTSVGSTICLLLLIGYEPYQIYQILYEIDLDILIEYDNDIIDDSCFGISTSNPLINIIALLLKKKNIDPDITFKKLYELIPKKIIITGVCLNDLSLNYFSYETTPDMSVLLAIRISISLPFVFKPVSYNNKIWVDGGCLNDYPIEIFDNELEKVIGIYTCNNYDTNILEFENKFTYIYQVIKCMLKGMSSYKLDVYKKYTINITVDCGNSSIFAVSNEEKERMYKLGYNFL
jgi:predicted acylesterase/phospholipase RssA